MGVPPSKQKKYPNINQQSQEQIEQSPQSSFTHKSLEELLQNSLENGDPCARLPRELFIAILLNLDPRSLLQAASVSHLWHVIGATPSIWRVLLHSRLCDIEDAKLEMLIRYHDSKYPVWDLEYCSKLTDKSLQNLQAIPNISSLSLNYCRQFSTSALYALLKKCGNSLTSLELAAGSLDLGIIANLCPNLRTLNLRFYRVAFRQVSTLSALTNLTDLNIGAYGENLADPNEGRHLSSLLSTLSTSLLTLNLGPGRKMQGKFPPIMPALQTLVLTQSNTRPLLECKFPNLTELDIRQTNHVNEVLNDSTHLGIHELLTHFTQLKRLNLANPTSGRIFAYKDLNFIAEALPQLEWICLYDWGSNYFNNSEGGGPVEMRAYWSAHYPHRKPFLVIDG